MKAVLHEHHISTELSGEEFATAEGGWDKIALTSSAEYGVGAFVDRDQAERRRNHWGRRAVLGLLTQEENRTR
ncbi:hypothetical protein GCM10009759_15200 [Kitasatospora saccharophila]|uniref:Uncharacterized protein n=1 Tax=Kitasatospora saccharophila TaxID=407973 RepID=A0ABN2WF45_9ACTN